MRVPTHIKKIREDSKTCTTRTREHWAWGCECGCGVVADLRLGSHGCELVAVTSLDQLLGLDALLECEVDTGHRDVLEGALDGGPGHTLAGARDLRRESGWTVAYVSNDTWREAMAHTSAFLTTRSFEKRKAHQAQRGKGTDKRHMPQHEGRKGTYLEVGDGLGDGFVGHVDD